MSQIETVKIRVPATPDIPDGFIVINKCDYVPDSFPLFGEVDEMEIAALQQVPPPPEAPAAPAKPWEK